MVLQRQSCLSEIQLCRAMVFIVFKRLYEMSCVVLPLDTCCDPSDTSVPSPSEIIETQAPSCNLRDVLLMHSGHISPACQRRL